MRLPSQRQPESTSGLNHLDKLVRSGSRSSNTIAHFTTHSPNRPAGNRATERPKQRTHNRIDLDLPNTFGIALAGTRSTGSVVGPPPGLETHGAATGFVTLRPTS